MNKKTYFTSFPTRVGTAALAVFLLLAGCGQQKDKRTEGDTVRSPGSTQIDKGLQERLQVFSRQPRVAGRFAFYVYDLTAGQPVYGMNEKMALPSASCMKLLTGVAGLHVLGTQYKYSSALYMRGEVKGGRLLGDVAFKPGLSPQIESQDLSRFAHALRSRGVSRIGGRLIVDLTVSNPVSSEEHWYPWDLTFSRYGLLYKGSKRILRELKYAMRSQGIALADSQVVEGRVPEGSRLVYMQYQGLQPVIQRMWKNSSNTQATAMLYTIGHYVNPKAEPTVAGVEYLRHFLREDLGQRDSTLIIHDGCGLCTYNRLSPQSLVAVLRYGYQHKDIYRMLRTNLSISGVDGTLRREMAGPKLRGRIYAKTGTLSHPYGISSLAGYCKGSNGHDLAFAIMDSEMSVLDARVLQRKLCQALVE